MKVNIEINEENELYNVTAYTGTGKPDNYVTDDLFSNPVCYETKEGHRMVEYIGLEKDDLESLSLANILKAMRLS